MAEFAPDLISMVDMNDVTEPRRHTRVATGTRLQIVLNCYQPGELDEFHYHKGSTRTYLVLEGEMTVRIRSKEGKTTDHVLRKGGCVLIPPTEYYQLHNHGDAPALIYQVSQRVGRNELMVWEKGEFLPQEYFTDEWRRTSFAEKAD